MYRKSPQNKSQIDALPSSDGGATIEEKRLIWKVMSVMQCVFNIMQVCLYEDMLLFSIIWKGEFTAEVQYITKTIKRWMNN